jgi:hypothetical protein
VKTLVGIVAAGIIGLALGGYALLWLRGPQGDILKVAQYLPPSLLPASFHQAEAKSGPASPNQTTPNQDEAAPIAATAAPPVATDSAKTSPIEPLRINDPAVKPAAATASMAPIVRDAPTYTIAQLSEALLGARDAQAGLQSGDLNDRAVQRTKGLSYEKLCGVAEMATFAEGVDGDATASAVDWVFRTTLAEPRVRGEVARIVPIWIGSTYRRHGGIFFAGAVVERNNAGSMIECRVDAGAGTSLVILVPPSLADTLANSYRPVAVVGSLVDRPAERVSGYTGSAPQAVWVGRLIPLSN